MKRLCLLVMVLVLLFSMSGCGGSSDKTETSSGKSDKASEKASDDEDEKSDDKTDNDDEEETKEKDGGKKDTKEKEGSEEKDAPEEKDDPEEQDVTEKKDDTDKNNISEEKDDPANVDEDDEESEEEKLPPRIQHSLAEATNYQGADERVLYGTYVFEKNARTRWDEMQTTFHFRNVRLGEINRYRGIYTNTSFETSVSMEPYSVSFGRKASSKEDGEQYFDISAQGISSDRLKKKEAYYMQKYEGEAAVQYLENLHKLYNCNYMEIRYVKAGKYHSSVGGSKNSTSLAKVICLYEVEGDTIYYTPLEMDLSTLAFEVPPKSEWKKMKYGFYGTSLILSIDGYEVELLSYMDAFYGSFHSSAYSDTPEGYNGIVKLSYSGRSGQIMFKDGSVTEADFEFEGDNGLKVSWQERKWASGKKIVTGRMNDEAGEFKCRYLNADDYGFVLIGDDDKLYYFMTSYEGYFEKTVRDSLEEGADVEALADNNDKISEIVETQQELVTQLNNGFEDSNVNVLINDKTGKITMDNSVLFGYNSAELSDAGMKYLDEFLKIYAEVVQDETFNGKIASVKIEGHADVSGTFDYNLELSQKRADSVAEYCKQKYPELAALIKTEGKSYQEPIYNEDGTINMEASRRVEFKVILNN